MPLSDSALRVAPCRATLCGLAVSSQRPQRAGP
jgi:hypothetical protein